MFVFIISLCSLVFGSLTIGDGAEFTVLGKMTGDILAVVTGMTVGLLAAVEGIRDILT